MDAQIKQLQKMIDESNNIVFFGGAGVSTESGIPDFRSQDGLYKQEWKYPPETIISRSFFDANPKEFYRFYREKLIIKDVKPNITHIKLAELEKAGKLKAIVTQNIDGLHQKAGSKTVYELHGSTLRNYCLKCGIEQPSPFFYQRFTPALQYTFILKVLIKRSVIIFLLFIWFSYLSLKILRVCVPSTFWVVPNT